MTEQNARLSLSLSPRASERLEWLKAKTDSGSYVEVFKNAMRLYEAVIKESDGGSEFMAKRPDGTLAILKIFAD